jgi:thioredoxin reductase (NADPH)
LYERVLRLDGSEGAFEVVTDRGSHRAGRVIVATGFFDAPNPLGVPGEDLPRVSHYFREPYPYAGQDVAVVGAKNSAAKAALQCFRHGARVTMLVRGPSLSESIKYWIRPDLENRIAEGSIAAFFGAEVTAITRDSISFRTPDGPRTIPNDWVLALTGYRPDYRLLDALGIGVGDDEARTPAFDPGTLETDRPGVFLAGTVCGGLATSRWFIENGRHHAKVIAAGIADRVGLPDPADPTRSRA